MYLTKKNAEVSHLSAHILLIFIISSVSEESKGQGLSLLKLNFVILPRAMVEKTNSL